MTMIQSPLAKATMLAAALLAAPMAALTAAPAAAQETLDVPSGAYTMDNTHATILWRVKHMGLSEYVARFESFAIDLTLDGETPANSAVSATVDVTSVSTPFPNGDSFNTEISTDPRFLNGNEFAEITFTSTSIEPTGPQTARITGDLTMLGVTRSETFDAEVVGFIAEHPFAKKPAIGFKAVGTIDRTAYGLDFLAPMVVAPEVEIEINAEFVKAE